MALQDFFRKQSMDESLAPKRGDVEHSGGDSPSKKQKGGVTPPSVKPAESSPPANSGGKGKGRGKGANKGRARPRNQDSGDANQLVNAMARLLLRHDEQLTALTSEVTFVSYAKTEGHSVLPILFAENRRLKSESSLIPPHQAMTMRFFRELKERLIAISKDKRVQERLISEGTLNSDGEWPFHEWSTGDQALAETLEEPLNTSQVVSGVGDILARLSTDNEHVKMFRTSRPLAETMTGGPVRIQIQFSTRPATADLVDSLQSLVGSSAFSLLNCDFQRQGLQMSPLARQVRDLMK